MMCASRICEILLLLASSVGFTGIACWAQPCSVEGVLSFAPQIAHFFSLRGRSKLVFYDISVTMPLKS